MIVIRMKALKMKNGTTECLPLFVREQTAQVSCYRHNNQTVFANHSVYNFVGFCSSKFVNPQIITARIPCCTSIVMMLWIVILLDILKSLFIALFVTLI